MEKGEGMGQKPSPFPYLNANRHAMGRALTDGMHPTQRNVTQLKRDVAWVGPTTTTTQA